MLITPVASTFRSMPAIPVSERNLVFPEESSNLVPSIKDSLPVYKAENVNIVDENDNDIPISLECLTDEKRPSTAPVMVALITRVLEDVANKSDSSRAVWIRTGAIIQDSFDYEDPDGCIWVMTEYAWYQLCSPSADYASIWHSFKSRHDIARLIVTAAQADDYLDYDTFISSVFPKCIDASTLGPKGLREELSEAVHLIFNQGVDSSFLAIPLISQLQQQHHTVKITSSGINKVLRARRRLDTDSFLVSQSALEQTRVTQKIHRLASIYFPGRLREVDNLGINPILADSDKSECGHRKKTWDCLKRLKEIRPLQTEFEIGNVVLTPRRSETQPTCKDAVPRNARPHDYFQFCRVISVDEQRRILHTQILVHSSDTVVAEINHPSELFYSPLCRDVKFKTVFGIVKVDFSSVNSTVPSLRGGHEYFCRYMYDTSSSAGYICNTTKRISFCSTCSVTPIPTDASGSNAVCTVNGHTYHTRDFILFRPYVEDQYDLQQHGPNPLADIGQIMRISPGPNRSREVCLQRLGRVDPIRLQNAKMNERELFITGETIKIKAEQLLRNCKVFLKGEVSEHLFEQPDVFVLSYRFPKWPTAVQQWPLTRYMATSKDVLQCPSPSCGLAWATAQESFDGEVKRMSTFDIFAGAGGFSGGMASTGIVQVTHANELAPSAARTCRYNSSATIVHNVCANILLERAVQISQSKPPSVIHDVMGEELPLPPLPGQIDVIVAGCPCQPHSSLNRFADQQDRKTELFLCLLSWIDFLKPKFVYFENVAGFTTSRLPFGGNKDFDYSKIDSGILKLFVHALLSLGYQTHFQVLQSGNHGAAQSRKRFFLIASRGSIPLPNFPDPLYAFPHQATATIRDGEDEKVCLLRPLRGVASHPHLTLGDAISDLVAYDWSHDEYPRAGSHRPVVPCIPQSDYYGPPLEMVTRRYCHEPVNNFQEECRLNLGEEDHTRTLQHFTMAYPEKIVLRVLHIELTPNANFTSLPREHFSHGQAHPQSANARDGYRNGYNRLSEDGVFHTIVTHIQPDAKQSYILHPYCRRTFTVREWARGQGFPDWFVFKTIDEDIGRVNVKQIHKQIGNAVAWPVARALGWELRRTLFEIWQAEQTNQKMGVD